MPDAPDPLPYDIASSLTGICIPIPEHEINAALQSLEPPGRYLLDAIHISPDGASANIRTTGSAANMDQSDSRGMLDAVWRMLCAKTLHSNAAAQIRTSYDRYITIKSIKPNESYHIRAVPTGHDLQFDLWIFDANGDAAQCLIGHRTEGLGRDRWQEITANNKNENLLDTLTNRCAGMAIIESAAIAPFVWRTFTARESERFQDLGTRRKKSFTSARIALKRLARELYTDSNGIDPTNIETIAEDDAHPQCSTPNAPVQYCCSASHDSRFATAVAARSPIGIDVERESDRVLKSQRLYMTDEEKRLTRESGLGSVKASLRIWTAKEACAKALDMHLFDAWKRVRLTRIGSTASEMDIDGKQTEALHAAVDDHLFTLVIPETE